jgi:hypothetical protein
MGGDVHQVDTTSFGLSAHPRRPVQQTAPVGARRPVGDGAALAAPREVTPSSGPEVAALRNVADYQRTGASIPRQERDKKV